MLSMVVLLGKKRRLFAPIAPPFYPLFDAFFSPLRRPNLPFVSPLRARSKVRVYAI
jgi:hypothetical protein